MNPPQQQTQLIVWGAFLVSPLMLGVVLNFVAPTQTAQDVPGLGLIFPALAFGSAAMGLILPERLSVRPPGQAGQGTSPAITRMILGLAFAESVALFGFVYGMMTASVSPYVPYAVVSLALMAWRMPGTLR